MSLLSVITESVRSTVRFTRSGVDRIRLEAKLRGLERRRSQALEALGTRVRTLSLTGDLDDERLTPEIADVAAAEMRIAACEAEIEDIGAEIPSASAPSPAPGAETSESESTSDHDDDDDAAKAVAEAEASARSANAPTDTPPGPTAPESPSAG